MALSSSPTGNTLTALLGGRFLCRHCQHAHDPGSGPATRCSDLFTRSIVHGRPLTRLWNIDRSPYYARYRWRTHNARWTEAEDTLYSTLITDIDRLSINESFPLATAAELADEQGGEALKTRHRQWDSRVTQRIMAAQQSSTPLTAQLDALLPPPFPVGWPRSLLLTGAAVTAPDAPTAHELERVRGLLPAPTIAITHPHQRALRTSAVNLRNGHSLGVRKLGDLFSANIPSWKTKRHGKQQHLLIDPNYLGLDPDFWTTIHLSGPCLTLTTQWFALAQSPPPPSENTQTCD